MKRTKPPFRADHVGSLLRPAALKKAREQRAKGEIDAAALKAVEDREIERVIKTPGRRRPAIDHRRRIPPLLVASRFPLGPRRHRQARHGLRHRLCRREHAQRRAQGHRQDRLFRPSDARAFQVRRRPHQAHTQDHHPVAVGGLRPAAADADRPHDLSQARCLLRRSRPGLPTSRARLRRRRLPLSAARRSVHRHAVRSELPGAR